MLNFLEWTNVNKSAKSIKGKKNANSELNSLYLTHIAGKQEQNENESKLACLCSNQIIHIYDQHSLKLISQIDLPHGNQRNKNTNDLGFYKKSSNNLFTCGDDGQLKLWDLRLSNNNTNSFVGCFKDASESKHEFLCADINVNDTLLTCGTNHIIDSSFIYIFDTRNTNKYLFKLRESHSSDISQIKFDPNLSNKFTSGGIDGLVCLFDLEHKNDDDNTADTTISSNNEGSDDEPDDPEFMYQCFNTMSSIQKLTYISSNELSAITLNGLFIYDLNNDDTIYSKNTDVADDEHYILDCFYLNDIYKDKCLVNLKATKNGNLKFFNKDELLFEGKTGDKNIRSHRVNIIILLFYFF